MCFSRAFLKFLYSCMYTCTQNQFPCIWFLSFYVNGRVFFFSACFLNNVSKVFPWLAINLHILCNCLSVFRYLFPYLQIFKFFPFLLFQTLCSKHQYTYFFHTGYMQRWAFLISTWLLSHHFLKEVHQFTHSVYESTHFHPFLPKLNIAVAVASLQWSSPPGFHVFVLSLSQEIRAGLCVQ